MPTAGDWLGLGTITEADQVDFGPRYTIERMLGQGGMGAVYKAYDKDLDRTVALKLIRPGLSKDPNATQRFKQELLLASKISHKNILRIHDLGDAAGVKFISMAYVEGQDLHTAMSRAGKLPMDRTVNIAKQLCAALEAAHNEGVVHRDLKPENVLLDKADNVFVSDFGLAKSLEQDTGMTRSGEFLGTPRYMAPEQVEGKKIDHRADLYALGLILYEMVTGDVPFHADTALQVMYKRVHEVPKSPKSLNPELPDWIVRIIMKCLEGKPELRYQSAAEILQDIERQHATTRAFSTQRLRIPQWEIPWMWLAGAVLLVAVAVGVWLWRARPWSSKVPAHGAAVSVLVADFANHTGDPVFDGTLEPMVNVALEGASFINAFSRGTARSLAKKLPQPTDKLDEQPARLVAVSQGVSAVITGEISRRGDNYSVSAIALDAVTGNVLARADVSAANKDEVVLAIPKLAAPIRKALGDTTPESEQLAATLGTFSAASLEVVHQYGLGQEQQFAGRMDEALKSFSKAAELDPDFVRAYAGVAAIYQNLGRRQDAEKYLKLAMEHVDRMTERERYRIRGLYYLRSGNWQNCVEEYSELVKKYPSDYSGHNNLAVCFKLLRNMPRSIQELRQAVAILPKALMSRMNLGLHSAYAGDFLTAEREAREVIQLNPSYEKAYMALAYAQVGQGQLADAIGTYRQLEKISTLGSSIARLGLADIALYEGRLSDAAQILEQGAAADLGNKRLDSAAANFGALAYVQLLRGQKPAALAALQKALQNGKGVKLRFLAARIYVRAGEPAKARSLAAALASEPQPEPQAYAKLIEGEAALTEKDARKAIQLFTGANNLVDTWIGRFDLGRAYLEAGLFVEADSEFDRCLQRRGETLDLFDDVPTYGYLPEVYYYQGRVREGLKSPGFVDSYRTYVNIRGRAGEDPLIVEVRRRLSQ